MGRGVEGAGGVAEVVRDEHDGRVWCELGVWVKLGSLSAGRRVEGFKRWL